MGEVIIADVTSIETLASAFNDFKENIETATGKLSSVAIVAGDFVDATKLETAVKTRTGELKTNLEGLSKALNVIAENLKTIADTYKTTADQNNLTAENLKTLIDGVEKYLPGLEND